MFPGFLLAVPPPGVCRQRAADPPGVQENELELSLPKKGRNAEICPEMSGQWHDGQVGQGMGSRCGNGWAVRWRWKEACQVAV